METFSQCYVCRADKNKACNRDLTFYQFPGGPLHISDKVWRSKWLAALKFSQEIIDKPPSQLELKRIICSRHFLDSCFTYDSDGKALLMHGSVPKLFLEELRTNVVQVEVTISDDENDGDETPSLGSNSGIIIPVHQMLQQNDSKEVDFASDDDSCASTVPYEEDRPAPPPMISHNAESVQCDRDQIIVAVDPDDRGNMSPGTSAFFEGLIDGIATKSLLTEDDMEVFSEHSSANQLAGVSITNSATPRKLFENEKGSIAGPIPMDFTTLATAGCSSTSKPSDNSIDNRQRVSTWEVISTAAQRLSPPDSFGMPRSVRTILPKQVEADDCPMDFTPAKDIIIDTPFQHSNTIFARDLFSDVNDEASPADGLPGLPESPSGSHDVTLDEPEEPVAPCGKVHCKLGCICDSLLTSRPPCGHFFCRNVNGCTKHARTRRHSADSNLLEMRREQDEERRERKIEEFIRERDGLAKRQVLRELYVTRCNLEDSIRENALLRSKVSDQQEENLYMKDMQGPWPVELLSSTGLSINGKDGRPLSEELLDHWATTLHKDSPCDFVAQLISEMFTDHYLATAPELQEHHIQAIIAATMNRFKTYYLDGKKKGRPATLTADLVKEFIGIVLTIYRE